jgi:hypothetical protein
MLQPNTQKIACTTNPTSPTQKTMGRNITMRIFQTTTERRKMHRKGKIEKFRKRV